METEARSRLVQAFLIHAAAFCVFLLGVRVHKVLILGLAPGVLQWLQTLSSEVALVLLLEAPWLLLFRVVGARARGWLVAVALFHLPIYLLSVGTHRFFQETVIVPRWEALSYALHELGNLSSLLATGLDWAFVLTLLPALLCLASGLLALHFLRRKPAQWVDSIFVPGAMTVLGAALMLVPTPSKAQLSSFWGNWLTDLLPDPVVRQYLERQVPLHPLYAPPVLLPGNLVEVGSARPNILIVVLESTRSDLLSAYSGKPSLSPFLDELATQSIVVDQMYTTVSHTTKALVGILCGMKAFPSMKAVEARPGGLPVPCLPRLLQQAGYTSGFFQSASNFERRTGLLQNMGFEQYFVPGPEQGKGFTQVGYLGWEERILRKPASTWMAQVHKPFFATVLTLSTHHPYDSAGTGPATAQSNAREHYDAAVRYVDEQVRGLFQDLKDAGVLENTIVLLMGDHGEAFDDHSGFRQHDSVPYDEVMRVPLLIYGPKFFQPRRLGGLRQHTDVVPTVLELAKQDWDGLMPGSSLLSTPGHEAIVASCWYPHTCLALRSGNLSFVFHYGHVPLEVYDLAVDPGQRHDIAPSFEPALRERAIDLMLGELGSIEHYYRAASGGP